MLVRSSRPGDCLRIIIGLFSTRCVRECVVCEYEWGRRRWGAEREGGIVLHQVTNMLIDIFSPGHAFD